MPDFTETLDHAFKARLPLIYLETSEEVRVQERIAEVAGAQRNPRRVWTWSTATGLAAVGESPVANTTNPIRALEHAVGLDGNAVFVFHDLHAFFGTDTRAGDQAVIRKVRETVIDFRHGEGSRAIIITAPVRAIPAELDKMTTLIDFPLPDHDELRWLLDTMIVNNSKGGHIRVTATEDDRETLVQAALGLTMSEAEDAFARAMVNDGELNADDVTVVLQEKRQTVRKSGLLDFVDSDLDLDRVGGLNNLKRWLGRRRGSWRIEAEQFGLPNPKGVLITGVPGCGKSLTAKATASSWGLPLLRLDIGRIFSGLVGSSEQNLRNALATAEAVSPCILWVDEIEKGFANTTGGGDSGTSARVFGHFLSWLQEKQKPVFVVATANNIDVLPPEFMRKGRFDEIFFVDLPTEEERRQIWDIQLGSRTTDENGLAAVRSDEDALDRLVEASANYSGAEIEQAVIGSLYEAFSGHRAVTVDDVLQAIADMIPLSVTQAEDVSAIRSWAAMRAVSATGSEDRETAQDASEQVSVEVPTARGGRTVDF